MFSFDVATLLAILAVIVLGAIPWAIIAHRVGFSPVWGFCALLPGVNLVVLILFLVTEWPIEEALRQSSTGLRQPEDDKVQAGWELKRLCRRVATLKMICLPESNGGDTEVLEQTGISPDEFCRQTRMAVEQFAAKANDEAARAAELLNDVAECELGA